MYEGGEKIHKGHLIFKQDRKTAPDGGKKVTQRVRTEGAPIIGIDGGVEGEKEQEEGKGRTRTQLARRQPLGELGGTKAMQEEN